MHIMQLANFHGPRSGGIRVALDELAHRYIDAGHRCTLVIPGEDDSVEESPSRRVYRVSAPVIPGLGGYRMILDRSSVKSILETDPPDLIELSDKTTLLGVSHRWRAQATPIILISHERLDAVLTGVIGDHPPVRAAVRRLNRRVTDRVDAIVAASRFAASEFDEVSSPPVHLIPLGVDLDCFRPEPVHQFRADGVHRLVTAVRLSPEKCPELAVEAVRLLSDSGCRVHLDVLGDGPLRRDLAVAAQGLPITFHGHVADRDLIAHHLRAAAVAIAPGPSETFGLAALEALASGTPIVVPRSGALPELITPCVGLAVESTPAAFADAIRRILTWNRAQARRDARSHAERFTWDSAAASMLDLFRQVQTRRAVAA